MNIPTIGKLLVLEGADGVGKSTQTELIKKYFNTNKIKFDYVHFPKYGHNEFSEIIAQFLRGEFGDVDKVDPIFVANIYAMDRYLYLPELTTQLRENDIVLLDRYVFSNMAFQGAKYPNNSTQSTIIKKWIYDFEFEFLELPYPDLNIFFNVPIKIIEERLKVKRNGNDRNYLKGKTDIHEADLKLQSRVNHNYLELNEYDNYKIVECESKSPEEIFNSYKEELDKIF